jgi:hypothetical protein
METLIIRYEKSNRSARTLIEAVKYSGYITIDKKRKTGLHKAIEDAKYGKTYPINNPANAIDEILGKNV